MIISSDRSLNYGLRTAKTGPLTGPRTVFVGTDPTLKEIREETGLYTALKYLTKDDRFNCDVYTTDITGGEKS